jgi:hypothetical protein
MPSFGHACKHSPHPLHLSGLTSAFSSTLMALNGQTIEQTPQPAQRSSSIWAMYPDDETSPNPYANALKPIQQQLQQLQIEYILFPATSLNQAV